jgi:hypothetical protein
MRLFLTLLLALAPSCALADMTATYGAPNTNFTMKIEIASNGDVRGDVAGQPGLYFITRGGKGYFIQADPAGPIVTRAEDYGAALSEQMAKMAPGFRDMVKGVALHLVEKGEVAVNGRKGTAYYVRMTPDAPLSSQPFAVISHDPTLAPLGEAMARQFDMSMSMSPQMMPTEAFAEVQAVLKTGAPISFGGAELKTISLDPIPASEFELPGPVEGMDHLRARLERQRIDSEKRMQETLESALQAEPATKPKE